MTNLTTLSWPDGRNISKGLSDGRSLGGIDTDDAFMQVYDALAYHVSQVNMNRRVKVVGVWSLQMTASAVLSALRSLVDPMAVHVRDLYHANGNPYYDMLIPGV